MKKFTEKLSKLIVTVVCASMIFQTVGIHAMATEIGDGVEPVIEEGVSEDPAPVVEPVPTTEPVPTEELVPVTETESTPVNEKVVAYEEQLKGIGQNALDKVTSYSTLMKNLIGNMDGVVTKAQSTHDYIVSEPSLNQRVLEKYNSYSQYDTNLQELLVKMQKILGMAEDTVSNANDRFDTSLVKAQSKEAEVTGTEGSVLLAQAEAVLTECNAYIVAAEQRIAQVQELQNKVNDAFAQKTVIAEFYVLHREKEIPDTIFGKKKDYVLAAVGDLYSGVATGDYSYLTKYQNEEIVFGEVAAHLKTVPTRDAINAALATVGDQLAEDETIEWYGIKSITGTMHVDGRIVKVQPDNGNNEGNNDGNNDDANEGNNDGNNDDANEGNNDANNDDANEGNNDGNNDDANEGNNDANNDDTNEGNNEDNNNDDANEGNNEDNNDDANEGNNDANVGNNDANNNDANNNDANVGNNNNNNNDANVGNNNNNNNDANVGNNNDNNNNANEGNDENNGADEELTTIEEEEVPLASTITDMTVIEDEETPLASGIADVCKTHWIILLLIMLYVAVQTGCIVSRNKKIKQMEEDLNNIAM